MATAAEPRAHTVFAAVGHLSSLKGKEGKLRRLAHELNDRKPDYVFVLGDMTLNATDHETKRFQRAFLDELDAPYYIAAGNHDLARARRDYKTFEARFGPRFLMVEDPRAHFVVIDTNAHIDRIEAELGEMFARAEEAPARPTILLTHHMIWRDYTVRRFFYKSTDILALLEGRVKAIIAGDHSSGFRRATVRGIDVYSVGMGKRGPFPLYIFTIGTVDASGALDLQSFPFKPQKDAQAAEGRL
jgi:predicted phosphodiesterase